MKEINKNNIFPKDPSKTYGLMELMKAKTPAVINKEDDTVFTWPHLLIREIALFVIVTAFILVLAYLFEAPLEEYANPNTPPNPAKAPWYFLGLQELVSYSAFGGGFLFPVVLVMTLIMIPYFDRKKVGIGIWFSKKRALANGLFLTFLITMLILIIIGTYFRGPNWGFVIPWEMPAGH
jgi:menaquinol-cytochrome c reductase cytochrome b/c subunit